MKKKVIVLKKEWSKLGFFALLLSLSFIFVFTFIIRVFNLTHFPIFADEAIYIRWAQIMRAEPGLRFLPLSDGKQPLFMWVMIPFLKIFSDPLFAGRILSVFTGLGTLIGIAFLSFELSKSKWVTLVSSFFYAISPFTVFFDRMALVDSMLSFFGVWALYFSVLTVRKLRFGFAILAGFALGGALLTKSPSLFFSLLLPTTFLLADWGKGRKKNFILSLKLFSLFVITYLIAYAMQNIMRLGENFHLLSSRNYDYVYPLSHVFKNPLNPLIPHLRDILGWFYSLGPAVLILFALGGIAFFFKNKDRRKEGILLSLWLLFPLLVQAEYAKVFTARYIFFTLPYLFILSSYSVLLRGKSLKFLLYAFSLIFISWSLMQDVFIVFKSEKADLPRSERSGYLEEWTSGYGIREVADYLKKEEGNGKNILVGTEGYFGTLPDGLQIYFDRSSVVNVIGVGLDFKEVPKSLIESRDFGNDTYLLVNDSRFLIDDYHDLGLELIQEYPKALRPGGSREKLLFFKLD